MNGTFLVRFWQKQSRKPLIYNGFRDLFSYSHSTVAGGLLVMS